MATRNAYDEIPYRSHPFPQSHPDRLATVATLLGLAPAPVARSRVLELGCAAGGNLIPMAEALPEAQFVGVDLSNRQLEDGRKAVEALGLRNIELHHRSIADIPRDWGSFDYIICHGVFSWVPADVRTRIFEVCRDHLAPNGVAYVSYNVYPGWHMRGVVRDMMRFHSRKLTDPSRQAQHSRALLDFMTRAVGGDKTPYGAFLGSELQIVQRSENYYLLHEHLEEHNTPVYFHEFIEQAEALGLRFLAETDLRVMVPDHFSPEIAGVLRQLSGSLVEQEQYMDFIRNRMFRQTLLCRADLSPDYEVKVDRLAGLHIASPVQPVAAADPTPRVPGPEQFRGEGGVQMSTADPVVRAALRLLGAAWPRAIEFTKLRLLAHARIDDSPVQDAEGIAHETRALGQTLLRMYATAASSLVDLYTRAWAPVVVPGDRPEVRPMARYQSGVSGWATNLRHETIHLTPFQKILIPLLNGKRERPVVIRALAEAVRAGKLAVQADGEVVTDPQRVADLLSDTLTEQLAWLGRSTLLVG